MKKGKKRALGRERDATASLMHGMMGMFGLGGGRSSRDPYIEAISVRLKSSTSRVHFTKAELVALRQMPKRERQIEVKRLRGW